MNATAQISSLRPKPRILRVGLRAAAVLVLLGSLGFWAYQGAHTGWSMHRVPVKQTDEITGIEFVTYEQRYVPGVDFLALWGGLAAALLAVSFFVQRQPTYSTT